MKITETQLRRIIREELQNSMDDSMFAEGVTQELFVEYITKFWGIEKILKNKYKTFNPQKAIKALTSNGEITQDEAEKYVNLALMCVNAEQPKYNIHNVMFRVSKILKVDSHKLAGWLYSRKILVPSPPTYFISRISRCIDEPWEYKQIVSTVKRVTADQIRKNLDFLNLMISVAEPKKVDKETLSKLQEMASIDYDYFIQAVELYSML